MATHLTRRELYDRVWARPMTKVAAELGISDVGLHKICDRHRIPVPGRGYWAKVAAGRQSPKALFREVSDPMLEKVVIAGSPLEALPPAVAAAQQKAKAAAQDARKPAPIVQTETLLPLLEPTRKAADKAKTGDYGFITLGGPKVVAAVVAPSNVPRMLAVLDRLIRAAESRAYKFEHDTAAPHLIVDSEIISLAVSEKLDRVRHETTQAEQKALERWQADYDRRKRLTQWVSDWDKPKIPEWDHVPNGLLVIELDKGHHWDRLRRKFSDSKRRRLEAMIDSVLVGAATCAAAIKAKREKAERDQRAYETEAKRRAEIDRRNRLEEKRLEFLDRQIKLLEEARRIEGFVDEYTSQQPMEGLPASCRLLINWAQGHAQLLRNAIAPEEVAAVLDKHRLMDDTTDIYSWVEFE